jgi:hypothetical protein
MSCSRIPHRLVMLPNMARLAPRHDGFDRLYQYKIQSLAPTWEQALEQLVLTPATQ